MIGDLLIVVAATAVVGMTFYRRPEERFRLAIASVSASALSILSRVV